MLFLGINFSINGNTLEASATDSYRVSKKKVELKEESKIPVNIIIPTRNLNELIKLLEEDDENIELHIFSNKIIFKFNSIIMMSRLINGDFPDLSKLIPDTYYLEMNQTKILLLLEPMKILPKFLLIFQR